MVEEGAWKGDSKIKAGDFKVRQDILRYVSDSIAIEDLASDFIFKKEAGLFQDFGFTGVASSIVSHVKSLLVEDDSPAGWLKAIANMLATGALFKLHPILGLTYGVANALGVDLIGVGKKVLDGIMSAAKGGGQISLSNIDYHGKIAMVMHNTGLFKTAQFFGRKRPNEIDVPFLPRKGQSKIESVFGNMLTLGKRGKLKTLLVAIVIWALKTALLGAGVIGGAGLVSGLFKGKSEKNTEESNVEPTKDEAPKKEEIKELPILKEPSSSQELFPSGSGTTEFRNDDKFVWIVPLVDDVPSTLAVWAEDIYPELSGYQSIMYDTPAFNSVVKELEQRYEPAIKDSLVMPRKYTSRKQVVDQFADDVLKQKPKQSIEGLLV